LAVAWGQLCGVEEAEKERAREESGNDSNDDEMVPLKPAFRVIAASIFTASGSRGGEGHG